MGSDRAIAALPTIMKLRCLIRPHCSRGDADRLPVLRELASICCNAMGGRRTRVAVGYLRPPAACPPTGGGALRWCWRGAAIHTRPNCARQLTARRRGLREPRAVL